MKNNLRRVKIGDVVEIKTGHGLAYAQYTHEHREPPTFGSLVRVLEGFFDQRLSDNELSVLVQKKHRFTTFTPLGSHIWYGDATIVGNYPIPSFAQDFPTFKNSVNPYNSEAIWWLWDGKKQWRVGKLSEEEKSQYPTELVCNWGGFLDHVETGKDNFGMKLS